MFKAKYVLRVKQDEEKLKNYTEKAVTFAELLDDDILVKRILEESVFLIT